MKGSLTHDTYPEKRFLMDTWLVAHPEFLRERGEEPVTLEQMNDLRDASYELIQRPNSRPPLRPLDEQRRLIARRDRHARLTHLYYLVRVGECLSIPVDLLELLERGSEAQRARYRELIETYEARVRYQPPIVEGATADRPFSFRNVLAVVTIALICLVLFLLHHS